ncbi:C40 family peptidase [Poseidonibacter ostreae]|jgi:cell wall-associated NlpC family hydrolase|uniref:Glycoside hydrolase n=1 Tax=Poseidonibacter ostreae TaxID=2654171 RepID=A0A6L4WR34_9BACT|nr:C40 family peptidase [Poseidonibacter ostreae]KAB7887772.1 glycoside hydrolase [Poseidonibacter ostreae]KAB7888231.1 glycoside hydrolase [Poseidonibacter ostreae]KAB7890965.1 glycoside hydrolase [Poseidonibacter ostreae]
MKILKLFILLLVTTSTLYMYLSAQSSIAIKETKEANSPIITNSSDTLISLAKSKLGSPYVYAKTGPDSFDCSGFVYYVFNENNMSLPRTSINQSKIGPKITRAEIKKGDLVFFDTSLKGHVNHSGIYLGEGKFIHASSGKANGVTISDIDGWYKDKFKWGIKNTYLINSKL